MGDTAPIIFGFSGRKGAGKDTAAEELILALNELGINHAIHTFAFADILKTTLIAALGLSVEDFTDRVVKETPIPRFDNESPRGLCKWIGETLTTKFGADFTVQRVKDQIDNAIGKCPRPIIFVTDVRFPNEADLIVNTYGGKIIYVDADERLGPNVDPHPTEQHFGTILETFRENILVINNNGDKESYKNAIRDKALPLVNL